MNAPQSLERMAEMTRELDLDAHMNLISKDGSVFGVPGIDVIDYDDRYNQCRHAFENKLLKQVGYNGLNILAGTPVRTMFKSMEIVEVIDGSFNASGIEFMIQQESNGARRVSLERVLPEDELEHDRRRVALQAYAAA
ncbi:MAG: hypothetical protein HKO86_05210 [Gammaproteobacteria bacterium]|nr:hypothetical protein [Gammaproteobacteria bacterium]